MSPDQYETQIGASIRSARRERNMTQTQLGGRRYSKSYISAIEHAKILPSQQMLQFLASQLDLPLAYFTGSGKQEEVTPGSARSAEQHQLLKPEERVITDELWPLLDELLERAPDWDAQAFSGLPPFSIEALDAVPASRQAMYAFLLGTLAQQKADFSQAVRAFEYALQHSPPHRHPAILDALGSTYALQRLDSLALHYHLQAHLLLHQQELANPTSPLHLMIPLHCAQDYRALGNYQQASAMYEDARLHLNARNSIEIAADLYFGLGYCVYGLMRNATTPATSDRKSFSIEEMEQGYQRGRAATG
jgi:transcriptional regulator with XRE-family HTH domain